MVGLIIEAICGITYQNMKYMLKINVVIDKIYIVNINIITKWENKIFSRLFCLVI